MGNKVLWVYGKDDCVWCKEAVQYLKATNREYTYIDIYEPGVLEFLFAKKLKTVPQIFIGDTLIGGYSDLILYFDEDKIPLGEL